MAIKIINKGKDLDNPISSSIQFDSEAQQPNSGLV